MKKEFTQEVLTDFKRDNTRIIVVINNYNKKIQLISLSFNTVFSFSI